VAKAPRWAWLAHAANTPHHRPRPLPARRLRRLRHAGASLIPDIDRAKEASEEASSRLERLQDRLPPTIGTLVRTARETEVLLFAGGLAFYGLISIAPFLVITFWIAGAVVGEDGLRELGENIDEMSPGGADASGAMDSLAGIGTGIGIGALVSALWPATAYGSGLVRAFDRISHHPKRSLQGARGRLKALLFVVLLPAFVLGALGASYVASNLLDDGFAFMVLGWVLSLVAGFVAGLVIISIIYAAFGPGRLPKMAVLQGASAAAGGLAVMSLGYVIYLGQGADFEERVAGSGMAAVVLLALWLYLANTILLTGYALACSCAGKTSAVDEGNLDEDEEGEEPDRDGEPVDLHSRDGAATGDVVSSRSGSAQR
jgi:membrane protein